MTRGQRNELLLAAAFAALVPVIYAWITGHIWEDYFITFRHSRNLVSGHGLVFQPGEQVHGFTSPLGVLLPAVFDWLFATESYVPALNAFRAVCIAAFAGGAVLSMRAMQLAATPGAARFLFAVLYSTEPKAVGFAVNGMETPLILLFLAATLYVFCCGWSRGWLLGGIAFAGLMWTRPDSVIYIAALSAGSLIFTGEPRRQVLLALLKAAAVCTVLYLPWFAFAWSYYGSPVPHTIIAKSPTNWPMHLHSKLVYFRPQLMDRITAVIQPTYVTIAEFGWSKWLEIPAVFLGLFSFCYWVIPSADRIGRLASLSFAIGTLYLMLQIQTYPWYLPPVGLLAFVAFSSGVFSIAARFGQRLVLIRRIAACAASLAVALTTVCLLCGVMRQMAIQQSIIENGHRRQIGLWLREHVQPGETVYLECLGYIGFFSNAKIHDWPGLVSPQVVELRRRHNHMGMVVAALKPDWIVARPHEFEVMAALPEVERNYRPVQVFDAVPALEPHLHILGVRCLLYDAHFVVLQRIGPPPHAHHGGPVP